MILTIAKIIVIWTLASIPFALIVSRLIGANERSGGCEPDEFRRDREMLALADSECADWVGRSIETGGAAEFIPFHDPLFIEGAQRNHG